MITPTRSSSSQPLHFHRGIRFIALFSWVCITLSACGISPDIHPRDIDPAKQDLLQSSTTSVATQDNANP